jgi:hypothetical protein
MIMATSSIFTPIVKTTKKDIEYLADAFEQAVEWENKHPYKPSDKAIFLTGDELKSFIEKRKKKYL